MTEIILDAFSLIPDTYSGVVRSRQSAVFVYVKDGRFHKEDGPALFYPDGRAYYYLYGELYFKDEYYKMQYSKYKALKDDDGLGKLIAGCFGTRE
jgi:hypothetical protein